MWERTAVLRGVIVVGILSLAVSSSCFDSDSIECENGLVCPVGTKCAANQAVCLTSDCGDGIVGAGEVCDDGNIIDGDGCSADCLSNELCGNGVVDMDAGEVCDDGNTDDGDGCSADCRSSELCGNGIVDMFAGEVCDDGNNTSGDGCSADCLSDETCQNGIRDTIVGEVCDDGNDENGDGCSADCLSNEDCGNGIVDVAAGEVCDDGNNISGDGCSADCRSDETCGNGVVDPVAGEVCDDGNNENGDGCSADCKSGEQCGNGSVDLNEQCDNLGNVDSATCDFDCTLRICGDGYANAAGGEQCDTGGETPTCNVNCTLVACGDGIVNVSAGEQCDNLGAVDSSTCDSNCSFALCGDNYTNAAAGEQCDTGGESLTCNSNCTLASCGDGVLNLTRGEQCDDAGQSAICDTDCTIAFCGDNQVNATRGEQCDTGGESTTCNGNCTLASCGDGVLNLARGEQCDVLGGGNTSTCDADCTIAFCGDGTVNAAAGEVCDNLGGGNTATCNANCTAVSCGDGIVNAAAGEQCDNLGGGNSATCDSDCTTAFCGDNFVNAAAGEQCDTGGETFTCNANCTIASCGDGVVNVTRGEQCDSFGANSATCDSDCTIAICGDGFVNNQAGEQCDDGNQNNDDACRNDCTTGSCGDGFLAPGEVCDDGNTISETECPYGTQNCTTCNATCTAQLNLTGRYCGDGVHDAGNGEQCDDGNSVNETECPYGVSSCDGCSNTCQIIPGLTGGTCGNGDIDPGETCDDGNGLSCGTCSASCNATQLAAATGDINATTGVVDGETIVLNDGLNSPLTFEFDTSVTPSIVAGRVRINISSAGTANAVRDAIITAVNGVGARLQMTAAPLAGSGNLRLTHDLQTARGNQSQSDTVADPNFAVGNMTGGFGNDCVATTGCKVDDDCVGSCVSGTCSAVTHTVGGVVVGLAGSGLVLRNNGGDDLPIAADGSFTFATALSPLAAYLVTVQTQPSTPAQTCAVSNGSGAISNINVTNVVVVCTTQTFTVGGNVTGLASGNQVVLQNNGGSNLTKSSNTPYTFTVPDQGGYNVTVLTQPTTPNQVCTVANPTGTVDGANITNVHVTCVTTQYTVGGSVTNLLGTGLVLRNNGVDPTPVAQGATSYVFGDAVDDGEPFAVTVMTQPTGPHQTCSMGGGSSGTINGANVTNANVSCTTNTYTVGGMVSGLAGGSNGVTLLINGGDGKVVTANGNFTFDTPLASGTAYTITHSNPTMPAQTCAITAGESGTVTGANINNIVVECDPP